MTEKYNLQESNKVSQVGKLLSNKKKLDISGRLWKTLKNLLNQYKVI